MVRAANQVNIVLHGELPDYLLAESKGNAAIVVTKFINSAFRITPQQVAEESRVRNICGSDYILDLFQIFEFRREASVHAENFLVDYCTDWQAVKHVRENFPKFDGVSALAFVVKPVNTVDLGALVIAAKQKEVLGVLDFVAKQQSNGLD